MITNLDTESIWGEFHSQLYAFIRRRVRDDALAEDLLQQVFLRIHMRIETLRDDTKLNAWIYQIARNVIADHYRAQSASTPLDDEIPEPESDTDDLADRLAPSIRNFVNALPDMYRNAFLFTEVHGKSQVELAQRLGISVSGAKSRVQRARAQVKQMLLDCCHFEFDRLGGVVNYYPRVDCCERCECKN
jgi:RNA polymerase sigma-70 factor (ECF subfamily)